MRKYKHMTNKREIVGELRDIAFRIAHYAVPYVNNKNFGLALIEIRKVQGRLDEAYRKITEVGARE